MIVNIQIAKSFSHYIQNGKKLMDGTALDVPEGTKVSEFLDLAGFPEKVKDMVMK
ncbi:MAG: hypothetical protein JW882_21400 [Deltaproteobacteria bacterium]|nr:hypothetical protein [Deltaproteobacteria bacterium]